MLRLLPWYILIVPHDLGKQNDPSMLVYAVPTYNSMLTSYKIS